jgi:hypothetical protein
MKQNKTIKHNRKKYINKLKRTRKLRDIKYDFSKIHPASIILNKNRI